MIIENGDIVWRQAGALSYGAIAEHVNRFVQAV
jgi:hypothetical protein